MVGFCTGGYVPVPVEKVYSRADCPTGSTVQVVVDARGVIWETVDTLPYKGTGDRHAVLLGGFILEL